MANPKKKSVKSTKNADKSPAVLKVEAKSRLPKKEKLPSNAKKKGRSFDEGIKIGDRRALVLEYRRMGASIRQISTLIKDRGYKEYSPATIHEDLKVELDAARATRLEKAEHLIEMELAKLEDYELHIYPLFKKQYTAEDTARLLDSLLKLQNQRDKFLSISKREKSKVNAREALAKLMGVDPDRLPKSDEQK